MKYEQLAMNFDEPKPSISVDLGERALHLTTVLTELSVFSKLDGLNRALHTAHEQNVRSRYNEEQIEAILASASPHLSKAKSEFNKAFATDKMIAGGVDPTEARYGERMNMNNFISEYMGPHNKKARARFRGVLSGQMKK